ncbi:TlpA disulfide reductase family protein [Sinisalibacter aestuarii]|uniref:TlpA family protein disulfide reductase n=1 Tax=Sinisalibacter aestuarii TaxID=2949426 RepID=A0ABQ5LT23_9RHOB|nr:TlpA disulfide reductase family protein [Sinisalibacter aestuarii]GKY87471.1 hypothetical protein STA1M1_13400 [Sinisalibacter aestuarii]
MDHFLFATEWLNTDSAPTLAGFRGRVLAVEVFQMLCPGCVLHGLPQAQRLAQTFMSGDFAVIGLHSVFEHHDANSRESLAAFLHEWRIRFPVAIDAPGEGAMPRTMEAWALQGTPSLVLFDRQGEMRARHFGQVPDLALGAEIMSLIREDPPS